MDEELCTDKFGVQRLFSAVRSRERLPQVHGLHYHLSSQGHVSLVYTMALILDREQMRRS